MVHGGCKSVGCYAMTDYGMEEIYGFVAEAFQGGQAKIQTVAAQAGAAEPVSEDKRGVTVGAAHSQCPRPKGSIALPAFSEIKRPPN
jgi:hypothetical protein